MMAARPAGGAVRSSAARSGFRSRLTHITTIGRRMRRPIGFSAADTHFDHGNMGHSAGHMDDMMAIDASPMLSAAGGSPRRAG